VNDTPIKLSRRAMQFIHVNSGSIDAFALAFADGGSSSMAAGKLGIDASEIDAVRKTISETVGDLIIMFGCELSAEAQAAIAASASGFAAEDRRVTLHPLPRYNNSVGANDMTPGRRSVDDVVKNSKALLIGGSLQDAGVLSGKDFVVVQELFQTETTDHADVVFPAASFAEVDGTFTNNAGNVQRVRKAIEPVHQSKPDWMITAMIAREMGAEIAPDWSASSVFRNLADATPAYEGLRYPALKDESEPVQAKYSAAGGDVSAHVNALKAKVEAMADVAEKITDVPKVGHKLHRLTTMTSKTRQFHLLAHGNPKPANLLVSPLIQFGLDGVSKEEGLAEAAAVGVSDRSAPGK
ncbi:MAG: molybdopterin-dependent oxidoreductase, partial [Pyrinomonadaceae bacterium]